MTSSQKFGFQMFVSIWNQTQSLSTPDIHFSMADWLEQRWSAGDKKLLMMAFRASGKSTITGLFCAWLLYTNPDLRILILAADSILARKMVRNVKRILERHPLTEHLKPERPDQWAGDRFTVRRDSELRDPSMLARGIASNITGSRADVIICDDVEVPNTCDTAEKRSELRVKLSEIDYVLVPGGTQIYIGTPHSYYTIYAASPRPEIDENTPFLDQFHRLEIPILTPDGESQWPERFTGDDIENIKRRTGPNKFASQMMLQPVNIANGRLDPDQLIIYDTGLTYTESGRRPQLYLDRTKLVSASAWWDPAFGKTNGDNSVFAVIFSDNDGDYYLHHLEYISQTQDHNEQDEATRQCAIVAKLAKRLYLPAIALEINGIGRFLPGILRRELAKAGHACAVIEITSRRPKHIRILEAFDVVLAARALNVHVSVQDTPFIQEMREWRPTSNKGHDDGLDAVAGALSLEPVRLRPVDGADRRPAARQNWTGSGNTLKARTDFNP